MTTRFLSCPNGRVATVRYALLALVTFALSLTNNSLHAQFAPTAVYEPGAEGEIWRFIGSLGKSYSERCANAGYDANVDCPLWPEDDELWNAIGFDVYDNGTLEAYRVYVADRFNWRVLVYDYNGNYLETISGFIGANGVADSLSEPEGLTVDAAGNLLVADTLNERIVVFDGEGLYRFEIPLGTDVLPAQVAVATGTTVAGPPGACAAVGPAAIAVTTWSPLPLLRYPDQVITDQNQVLLFDANMCKVNELGEAHAATPPPPGGNFYLPGAPAFGPRGEVYVGAYAEDKIEVFFPDASFPSGYVRGLGVNTEQPNSTLRDPQGEPVRLDGPYGVLIDSRGRLVVGDTNNNRIAVLLQPWHPDNTSARDPQNPSIGIHWQFAFQLVAGGNMAGSWLATIREDSRGRWLVASVMRDVIFALEIPELAIIRGAAEEVATENGDVLRVRGNVAVPVGKSALTNVVPSVSLDALAPAGNRASLGPPQGPFLAAPLANIFDGTYVGVPIDDIDDLQPGHYAQVYWDFPVQSDGQAQFWISAHKPVSTGDITAEAKTVTAESVAGSCVLPMLNTPVFDRTPLQVFDATTNAVVDVYGNPVTLTFSASAPAGVREIEYQHLDGFENGTRASMAGPSSALRVELPYQGSAFRTIRSRAIAQCGARSEWATTRFKIDGRAPRLAFGPVSPAQSGSDPEGRAWYAAPAVSMQVVASDDDTFQSNVVFPLFPDVTDGRLSLQFTAEGAGQQRLVQVRDPLGNEFAEWTNVLQFINIDRSAPQLMVSPLAAPNIAGWYRTDVPLRVVTEEAPQLSGVKSLTSSGSLTIASTTRHRWEGQSVATGEGLVAVSLAASDFAGNVRTATSEFRIDKTAPQVAVAPAPLGLHSQGMTVQLSALDLPGVPNAVSSGLNTIRYSLNGGAPQTYVSPIVINTLGITEVTIWAEDMAANMSVPRTVSYTVVANRPPACVTAVAQPGMIWPVNHREVPLTIGGVTDPDGDRLNIVVSRILQDEPTNTVGDGNTSVDAGGLGTAAPWVRAERMGSQSDRTYNNGRLYEIFFTASDGRGGSCSGTVTVGVPHDQGRGSAVVDNGCRWDSRGGPVLFCAPGSQPPRGASGKR